MIAGFEGFSFLWKGYFVVIEFDMCYYNGVADSDKMEFARQYMKKISEKYYLDYFILFILLCVLEIMLIISAIMHPRPQNIMLVLIDGIHIFLNGRWMNKAKYVSPYDYYKEVKAWKKQKKRSKEAR